MANLLDFILAPTLVVIAAVSLGVKDLFTGIVFYILFGLLTALAWVELKAPDVALVEAAIGAGLIGALFLAVLGRMESSKLKVKIEVETRSYFLWMVTLLAVALLIFAVTTLSPDAVGLSKHALEAVKNSGASNLTTAVIINFRAYDTLLELAVMLVVTIGAFGLHYSAPARDGAKLQIPEPLLVLFLRLLTPFMVLVAGYLLWVGSEAPGGAFQAGAILTGAGILLLLGKVNLPLNYMSDRYRFATGVGLLGFVLVGVYTVGIGGLFLQYPFSMAKAIVLAIEAVATISIGMILLTLFAGCAGFLQSFTEETKR